jgi:hypothetical protein
MPAHAVKSPQALATSTFGEVYLAARPDPLPSRPLAREHTLTCACACACALTTPKTGARAPTEASLACVPAGMNSFLRRRPANAHSGRSAPYRRAGHPAAANRVAASLASLWHRTPRQQCMTQWRSLGRVGATFALHTGAAAAAGADWRQHSRPLPMPIQQVGAPRCAAVSPCR